MAKYNKYDMDPEYFMDDDQEVVKKPSTARPQQRSTGRTERASSRPERSSSRSTGTGSDIKLGSGEELVKKNPDGSYVVRKADGKLVKRRPTESASQPKIERPSTRRAAETQNSRREEVPSRAAEDRPIARPQTSRAKAPEVKIGPGETIVRKEADGSVIVRKADGKLVKRRPTAAGVATTRENAESARRSRNSKYVNKRPSKKAEGKKKLPIFWIGLGIWIVILLIFGIYMLNYTDKCLVKYEKSQAEVAMKDFMKTFEKQVKDKTLADHIELPDATGELEDASVLKNVYMSQFDGATSITYEKDPKSYDTSAPFYNIYAHFPGETDAKGTKVARMTLKSKNSKKVFAILQLVDWSIDKIEPVLTVTTYNYSISVPNDFAVKVNGIQLTDEYLTGESVTNPEFQNVMQYVDMPSTIQYKIAGLVNKPDIKIYDATGAEVSYTPDDKGNIFVAYSAANSSAELTDEIKNFVLEATQNWQDFLNADLGGENHGFVKLQKYLIEDSYYWKLAKDYASGPDITFMADHTIANPKYTDLSVDNYIRYTDNCYSVHAKFTKHMILTRTGAEQVDPFDQTVYFVKQGDQWYIADMIQMTKDDSADKQ